MHVYMHHYTYYIHLTTGLREQWLSLLAKLDRTGLMQIAQSVLTGVLRVLLQFKRLDYNLQIKLDHQTISF